jgi:hypothetical protein
MTYLWLIAAALLITWIAIASITKKVDALAHAAPLQYVYQYDVRFTNRLIHEILKLTPEEYDHLKPAIENHIYLKIEFWRGHLVVYLTTEGSEQNPRPVYLPPRHFRPESAEDMGETVCRGRGQHV